MRQIKFRAWDKENKRMLPVDYMKLDFGKVPYVNGETFSKDDGWFVYELDDDDFELMQYTGLKDKNGVEVYEGDIIRAKFIKDGSEATGWIEYFDKDASFICHLKGGDYALLVALSELEVIGNIYENPEFLKDKK
ncbi:YopX family protein [Campylobacter mucosalis]|uniref:YopX family protein n=1 Tax=Campylobacter mucosalis CCUG 21559 TaxID=1032067 RepID=A0A6G5QEJ5_9BACT|nr:YopX family protein [Campylobacter mucosalis]QCD44088.1 YopX family protein [Campylobacter mucosalis CCUG 21559]QCD44426.1 YopX family protein [Campylobacter mucosalis CCUG 21559]